MLKISSRRLLHHITKLSFSSKSRYSQTFYQILDVSSTSTDKEIKSAFLKKAKTMHPDTLDNPTEENNKAFQDLTEAYQTLKDPVTRKMYDINLSNGVNDRPESSPNFSGFNASRRFYENRWYNNQHPKDDLRFTEDFTTEYNEYLNGGPINPGFFQRRVSKETYTMLTNIRFKFLVMVGLILLFEWVYLRVKRREATRLDFLHEMEDQVNPEYSSVVQDYIEGRVIRHTLLVE